MNIKFQLLKVKNIQEAEDFNQRLFDYVIKEIKKIDVFKNIQKEVILKGISRLKKKLK